VRTGITSCGLNLNGGFAVVGVVRVRECRECADAMTESSTPTEAMVDHYIPNTTSLRRSSGRLLDE